MLIFIDTETTGLPKKRQDALLEPGVWPDIVSIAWIVTTDDGIILRSLYTMICPDGWVIPADSTRIHKITHETAQEHGLMLKDVVGDILYEELKKTSCVVAHNLNFDKNVIINAFRWRLNMDINDLFKRGFCTMEEGRVITKLPGINGKEVYRCPKLSVLYSHLFGKDPEVEIHNAMNDAILCMKIYFKVKNLPTERPLQLRDGTLPTICNKKLSLCLAEPTK